MDAIIYWAIWTLIFNLLVSVGIFGAWVYKTRQLWNLLQERKVPLRFHRPYSSNADIFDAEEIMKRSLPFNKGYWSPVIYLLSALDEEQSDISRRKRSLLILMTISFTLLSLFAFQMIVLLILACSFHLIRF